MSVKSLRTQKMVKGFGLSSVFISGWTRHEINYNFFTKFLLQGVGLSGKILRTTSFKKCLFFFIKFKEKYTFNQQCDRPTLIYYDKVPKRV